MWYEHSAGGLTDAAKTVASMAAPVTEAVAAVSSLLAAAQPAGEIDL